MHITEHFDETEYIKMIGRIVSPKNVIFSIRISSNSFCIYLETKNVVDKLINKPGLKTHFIKRKPHNSTGQNNYNPYEILPQIGMF